MPGRNRFDETQALRMRG